MTSYNDLPAAAVCLIARSARTRHIPGTYRYAQVCRAWRDAFIDSEDHEQLQLVLALAGLAPDAVTSTSRWLGEHGQCVTSLHIWYTPPTRPGMAPLLRQLPLSTAPLAGLKRLEVDGPYSLAALAPALPQLVALTHLRASVDLIGWGRDAPAVLSTRAPLQLRPGLKSLHLTIDYHTSCDPANLGAPLVELLPVSLQELRIKTGWVTAEVGVDSRVLTPLTALHRLHILYMCLDPDPLFHMPGLEQLQLVGVACRINGNSRSVDDWLAAGLCTAPQHLSKLTGMSLRQMGASPEALPLSVAAVPGLRKLTVNLSNPTAAWAQHLSGLGCLRHLEVMMYSEAAGAAAAMLSGVSCVSQLTCLRLSTSQAEVPRSTWAAALPHLTQLRVLCVPEQLLLEGGLARELSRLMQLQCLYVQGRGWEWDPAACGTEVAAHLEVLSQCSSLRAVLCWSQASYDAAGVPLWEHVHGGRVHLSAWDGWCHAAKEGRVVCPRPCPHLPGVLELQQQEPADGHNSG